MGNMLKVSQFIFRVQTWHKEFHRPQQQRQQQQLTTKVIIESNPSE